MSEPVWLIVVAPKKRDRVINPEAGWNDALRFPYADQGHTAEEPVAPNSWHQARRRANQAGGVTTATDTNDEIPLEDKTKDQLMAHVLDTFGSVAKAERWLQRPNPLFDNKTPLQMIDINPRALESELVRIDHGVYI